MLFFSLVTFHITKTTVVIHHLHIKGGAVYIEQDTGYSKTGRLLYKKVLEKNQREFFPLWGTCLGMELVLYAHNNDSEPRVRLSKFMVIFLNALIVVITK